MNDRDSLRKASLTCSGSDHLDPRLQGTRYRPLRITPLAGQHAPRCGPSVTQDNAGSRRDGGLAYRIASAKF